MDNIYILENDENYSSEPNDGVSMEDLQKEYTRLEKEINLLKE